MDSSLTAVTIQTGYSKNVENVNESQAQEQGLNLALIEHADFIDNNVSITVERSIGRYEWCSSVRRHYLTNKGGKTCSNIKLTVNIPSILRAAIDCIEVYDSTRFLAHYNVNALPESLTLISSFPLKLDIDEITVQLGKRLPRPASQDPRILLSKTHIQVLFTRTCSVPTMETKEFECPICFDEVIGLEEGYLSSCHHLYHRICMWKVFSANSMCIEPSGTCKYDRHGKRTISFPCLSCDKMLEDYNDRNVY